MTKRTPPDKKYRLAIFFDDPATMNLIAKVGRRRGYEVIAREFPQQCVVATHPGCACTKEARCADIVILGRHFGAYRALEFLEAQKRAGCRLSTRNKLIVCSTYDEQEEARAKQLSVEIFYLPFALKDLEAWLDACEARLRSGQVS